jgi:anti-anti-sigma regulatory factor
MIITITRTETPFSVTILHLEGKLDGANYENLIEEAQNVYDAGVRDLILDLGKLTFISSAGLASMHQVALLFRGERKPGWDGGWDAYHAIDRDRGHGFQEHVKLLSPPEPVRQLLDMTGFNSLFEIFTDLDQAVGSFHQPVPAMQAQQA